MLLSKMPVVNPTVSLQIKSYFGPVKLVSVNIIYPVPVNIRICVECSTDIFISIYLTK